VNALARRLLAWCDARLHGPTQHARRPWVLGLQGPQGCGKSTAAAALVEAARNQELCGVSVSIDDFYLTHPQQLALAERHSGNPYLLYRGYPGTHDVALGARVIDALRACGAGSEVLVPSYDKSAHAGRGDRAPEACWRRVTGPFDFVVVEGWLLGFRPVDAATLQAGLVEPNRYLAAYREWNLRLDALVHLTVESLETIVEWRVGSERARRERGETALSEQEAADYIRRFLPAYRVYVPALQAHPPCTDFLRLELGRSRDPLP
jgi:D-glycerate 3-kinase